MPSLRIPAPTNARQLALAVLLEHAAHSAFVTELLEQRLEQSQFPAAERRLATELTYGIVRRQATLDALIAPTVSRPRENVEAKLWTLLRLGVYQLAFLDSVPSHAALFETVDLTRWLSRPRWSGFVNGVLRSVERTLTAQFTTAPAADAVPLLDGHYRRLTQPVFPPPVADPSGYLSSAFSLPRWLVERWQQRFAFEELTRLGFWFNTPPTISLRVNSLRTDRDRLLAAFNEANVDAQPGGRPESVRLAGHARIDRLPGFAEGHFTVQDESAMGAALLLDPQPGDSVLDLCAAPGTKTTHLAERMHNRGSILATDVDLRRLALVEENCRRLDIQVVRTQSIQHNLHDLPPGPFDAILVDVPCSNTGVLGKRPDARWRINPHDLEELPRLQLQLLLAAAGRLKPHGRLVYSTCSIEPEENEQVVERALHALPGLDLIEDLHHLPGQPADGGYQALLHRLSD